MRKVKIYTDGSCWPNPGPGGWAAVLVDESGKRIEISGSAKHSTNNRMEMFAVASALSKLKFPCDVTITTDSQYVMHAFTKGWITGWEKNGWRKQNKLIANAELWVKLKKIVDSHNVNWKWIRGHTGHPENERCDVLAGQARKELIANE